MCKTFTYPQSGRKLLIFLQRRSLKFFIGLCLHTREIYKQQHRVNKCHINKNNSLLLYMLGNTVEPFSSSWNGAVCRSNSKGDCYHVQVNIELTLFVLFITRSHYPYYLCLILGWVHFPFLKSIRSCVPPLLYLNDCSPRFPLHSHSLVHSKKNTFRNQSSTQEGAHQNILMMIFI